MVHQAQGQMVQEVAAAGLPTLPTRYILKEEHRPTPAAAAAAAAAAAPQQLAFPSVDVQRLADPADVEEADKLRSALQSWGLFKVTGHGMPVELLDGIRDAGLEFFHLPSEEKLRHANRDAAGEFQPEGYGIDRVDTDEQVLDWCDRLYLTVAPESERRPEFWPPSLAGLLHEYARGSGEVAARVLEAMSRLLGLGAGFFPGHVGEHGGVYARFTYYPPCPRPELVYGLKPHTDNSVVTVLLLDRAVGGLQVLLEQDGGGEGGRWVEVPVLGRDELLVVVGEEMEIMSNAVFRAPTHRVVADAGGRERMSLVMFYQPEPHRDLQPVEELVGEDRPAMYRKLKAKAFGDGFWDAFALGERTIDFLNIKVDDDREAAAA